MSTSRRFGRRQFLIMGGWTTAGVMVGPGLLRANPAEAAATGAIPPRLAALDIFAGNYPRAHGYRQSEVLVNTYHANNDYAGWSALFEPLMGIEGKILPEERTDTVSQTNLDWFNQFKADYPSKLVLAHVNGWAQLPTWRPGGAGVPDNQWYAGWWLYAPGSPLANNIDPTTTTIPVVDATKFRSAYGKFMDRCDDIVVCPFGNDGKPNFSAAEHMRIDSIDTANNQLTVRRGQYGSNALAFAAGAYIGRHVVKGPFSEQDDFVWLYNFATNAPRDPVSGKSIIDVLVGQYTYLFSSSGPLANFDGVALDVLGWIPPNDWQVDCDGDGVVDNGIDGNGFNVWGAGTLQYTDRLKTAVGFSRLLVAGSAGHAQHQSINGVEREGFPNLKDYDFRHWSEALTLLQYWNTYGRVPQFAYPLYKYRGDHPVSYNRWRLTLAAAHLLGTPISYDYLPNPDTSAPYGPIQVGYGTTNSPYFQVWDEIVAGTANTPGWLGKPLKPPVRLVEAGQDVLGNSGVKLNPAFMARIQPTNANVTRTASNGSACLTVDANSGDIAFQVGHIQHSGSDLTVVMDVQAQPLKAYESGVARYGVIAVSPAGSAPNLLTQAVLLPSKWTHLVLYFNGLPAGNYDLTITFDGTEQVLIRRIRSFDAPDLVFREFEHGAFFANPSQSSQNFDVAALSPGSSFVRIQGTVNQDPTTNDGSAVGSSLTVPATDALFVQRSG